MLFNSYIFIFVFLPVTLSIWWALNHMRKYSGAQIAVILLSLIFYGYYNYRYVAIILISIFGNWTISKIMEILSISPNQKKGIFIGITGILFNIMILGYFKYFNFFMENINAIFKTDISIINLTLPLGISFYTIQQIAFIVDRMLGRAPHYLLKDYFLYVSYFPQLIAGPIVSHKELIPQFYDIGKRKINSDNVLRGIRIFVIGLGKKVLLADTLGRIVGAGYNDISSLDSISAFVVMLSYTFQLFFDFSGYCDMAMGIGYMMNITLPLNFDSPYKAISVKEFWNRWHMTLNKFFVQYIYIPLGGSYCNSCRKICNILIVFFISGIWHGANWTFIVWGLLHGIMVAFENVIYIEKINKRVRWLLTFIFVNLTWIIFRSNSISDACMFYRRLFSFAITNQLIKIAENLADYKTYILHIVLGKAIGSEKASIIYLLFLVLLLLFSGYCCTKSNCLVRTEKEVSKGEMLLLAGIFSLCIISLSGVTEFLYFNF